MKCEICGKEILRDSQCINYKYYHNDCIENLQQENKRLNGAIQTYDILLKSNVEENKQLKDNWNNLKKYIGSEWYCFDNESVEFEVAKKILNKMQELEQGSGSNE
jgi:hypothetical protein|nr:MAG TPA_asm: C2H2 type zinc-finger protein [Caudoviricetes sp.]